MVSSYKNKSLFLSTGNPLIYPPYCWQSIKISIYLHVHATLPTRGAWKPFVWTMLSINPVFQAGVGGRFKIGRKMKIQVNIKVVIAFSKGFFYLPSVFLDLNLTFSFDRFMI